MSDFTTEYTLMNTDEKDSLDSEKKIFISADESDMVPV
jgi:hypothetical protein